MRKTFAELFCGHHRLPPEKYAEVMARHCLYRRTLVVWPLLRLLHKGYFDADLDFISNVGLLRQPEDLKDEINAFFRHRGNRGFLRRVLRLRVSARRVGHTVQTLMPASAHGRGEFPAPGGDWRRENGATSRA